MSNSNTIFGWVLFSGIVGLGLTSVSSKYFGADNPTVHGDHWGYKIEAAAEGGGGASEVPLADRLAQASAENGAALFAKCAACHTAESGGAAGIGPNLFGVIGTPVGTHAGGFAYSSALTGKGGNWTYENLDAWLTSPRAFANGNKMSFPGLSNGQERADVIAYLVQNGGGPAFPAPAAAPAEAAPAEGEAAAAPAE